MISKYFIQKELFVDLCWIVQQISFILKKNSLRTDNLYRPHRSNYGLNTSSYPWRCEAKCDHVCQKDLKPALISRDSKKYNFTTKSLSSKPISQLSH